jgi:outer membrane receptor for ferrienterochelin and colicins
VKTDVITRAEADRRGATNVAEALASQPGLVVNPGSYGFLGGASALQIQGFDRDRVLILEDGERVIGDVGGAIDLATIPTGDIDRIEIVSGPTSALYGSSALGGVVNILTAPPRDEGPTGRLRTEYRSLNGVVLQGNAGYRRGAPWAALDFNLTRMDGIEKGNGPDLRVPETSHRMVGVRAGTSLTPTMDVRVRARQFRDRTDGLETQRTPGFPTPFITDTPSQTDRYTLHVIHTTRIGSDGSNLRLTMGRQWFDNVTARDRRESPIDEHHDRTQRMQSFEATGTIADGPRTWVAGARAEAEHFEQDFTRTDSVPATGGTVTTSAPEVVPQSYGTGALYGQVAWKLGDFTVLPGTRFESHTRYGSSVAPRLAAAWRASDVVTLRASGGRGFRAPSPKELGFAFDHSAFGYKIFGNDALKPEKSWGVNADLTVTPTKQMTFRGSVYANWVDDLIDLDLGHGRNDNGVVAYAYTNFGRARTAGGQVDAAFKPAPWVRAESSYSYTWTRDDVNDQPLPGRPPHAVTVSLRLEPGWKTELYARARIVTDAFLDDKTRAPGYENLDVRVGRELWPKSQLYVGAVNLTNVKQDPGRVGDTRSPLGRILYVGLKADFPWEDE